MLSRQRGKKCRHSDLNVYKRTSPPVHSETPLSPKARASNIYSANPISTSRVRARKKTLDAGEKPRALQYNPCSVNTRARYHPNINAPDFRASLRPQRQGMEIKRCAPASGGYIQRRMPLITRLPVATNRSINVAPR